MSEVQTWRGQLAISGRSMDMAGAPGFEPGNAGTKNRCLTAWRRPNMHLGAHSNGPPSQVWPALAKLFHPLNG